MVRIPTERAPTHPGEMLLEEFLQPMDLTQKDLAEGIHVPFQRVTELVRGRRGATPSTALSRLKGRLCAGSGRSGGVAEQPDSRVNPAAR